MVTFGSLQTLRLDLLPIAPEFADEMFVGLQDLELYHFISDSAPVSLEWLRERYRRLAYGHSPDKTELWLNWVLRENITGKLKGYVQATVRAHTATIAYLVFPEAWGNGYACEAVREMMATLVKNFGVTALVATVHTENVRSITLLERLGYTPTRFTVGAEMISGKSTDEYVYSLSVAQSDTQLLPYDPT